MALLEGQIIADVDVNGTITEDGIVSMDIDVLWKLEDNETPIKVTFTTDKVAGIASIASEDAQKVEYFNIQGVRVNATDLVPGLYITRQGDKVTKVIVK